jgi:hypothetical protein
MVTVKDLFKKEREAWLESARLAAKELLEESPLITIEDVLKVCPRPEYIHRNTTGKVFNNDFQPVGWRKSKRPIMNGRFVRIWRLKDGRDQSRRSES